MHRFASVLSPAVRGHSLRFAIRSKATALAIVAAFSGLSCAPDSARTPESSARLIDFTTDEGTWMSVDVSPDGRTIAFDLLGQLYTIPITGGSATRLLPDGFQWDECPRYSPDGSKIAFVSDRGGVSDVWMMTTNGGEPRRVTDLADTTTSARFGSDGAGCRPAWSRDGATILSRARVSGSGLRTAALDGTPGRWIDSAGGSARVASGALTPDGKTLFYSARRTLSAEERLRKASRHDLHKVDLTTGKHQRVSPEA